MRLKLPMRIRRLGARLTPDMWAMAAIVGGVAAAHIVYLLSITDPNPLGPLSKLASSTVFGYLGGSFTIDPNIGYTSQALGHRAMLDLIHLNPPWWNPDQATGAPLAGDLQSAALFPPTLLLLVSNGQMYEHMLLETVAGLATYCVLRRVGLIRAAAVTGAIAFALNGTFAWFNHATANPVAFLPVILLGIEHAYDAAVARRPGGWWLIAVGGALSFYGGFPEVTYIDALLIVLWFAWRCCIGREHIRALVLKAAAGVLVALLLGAPLLIAALPFLSHAALGSHVGGVLGSDRLGSIALPQLIMPYIYGPIFGYGDGLGRLTSLWGATGGYLTVGLLAFAALGVCARGHRGLRLILGLFVLLAFSRMYSAIPVLGDVIGVLPNMGNVAFFRYATSALEFAVIALAAIGLDDVIRVQEHRRRVVWAALGGLVLVGLGALKAHSLTSQLGAHFASRHYFEAAVAWAVLVLAAALGSAVRIRDLNQRGWMLGAVLSLDALIMFALPTLSAPAAVQIDRRPVAYLQSHLGTGRVFTLGPLQPNYGAYFGVASINNNDFPPSNFARWVRRHLDSYVDPTVFVGNTGGGRNPFAPSPSAQLVRNLNGYRAAGVSYVITPSRQSLSHSPTSFTLAEQTPTLRIYRLAGAAPYFQAVGCTSVASGRQSVSVSCPRASTLIRRETYFPGWAATIDDRPTGITQNNGLFQAVKVPAGRHEVRFGYAPPGILWGLLAFVAGLLALAGAAMRRRSWAV